MSNAQNNLKAEDAPLPTAPETLLSLFDELNLDYKLTPHKAVFTVAESEDVDAKIPGTHCRNMFLRDKKKKMFLVSLANETEVDLKKMENILDCGRISFGSADRLWENLGVRPGSVCPYSVINNSDRNVPLILDKWMMEQDIVNFHPLVNTMTVTTPPQEIIKFLDHIEHPYKILDLSGAKPE